MVNLVTSEDTPEVMERFTQHLLKECPFVTTVTNNITARFAQIAFGEKEKTYYGDGYIREHIGGLEFVVSANSFFQTNTKQAEKLYATAKEFADFKPTDVVWDLYSGTGTITLFVADAVKKIIGIEQVESAIADAKRNAEHNKVTNVEFICGDVKETLLKEESDISHSNRPDCILVDPPRTGLHPDVVKELLNVAPERIVYVSCNPATQARDLKILSEKYTVEKVQPVDMFPHTYHIEAVAKLVKKKDQALPPQQ
jgi:23S rRNA (uracil1939-C5)-methyltransferase